MSDIQTMMNDIGQRAKAAAAQLALADPVAKQTALIEAAKYIEAHRDELIAANAKDMEFGRNKGLSIPMLDRLELNADRITGMCEGLRTVAAQDDPVGRVLDQWSQPSGLDITKVSTPIGVIGVIYESRPNVTADAGALAVKSGNAVILRGGSESYHSAQVIAQGLQHGLRQAGLPEHAVQLIPTRDRAAVNALLGLTEYVDVIVPRGGKSLVALVQSQARVPVFSHLEGIVHLYIDAYADPVKALNIVLNAKTRRVEICGAAECLLIHEDVADTIGRGVVQALIEKGVEVHADAALKGIDGVIAATDADWGKEFLDRIIAVKTVGSVHEAIAHIAEFGSDHTDGVITEDEEVAELFFKHVNSAIVMLNSSTQFADGGEFGMGAEIGIATGKLHARGPVGAAQLTSYKYQVRSNGAVRG